MADPIQLKHRIIEGGEPGPHLLIIAGVHGDEYEGPAAIHRLAELIDADGLRGRVTLVPIVNEASFWRAQRTAEDELDLARTCPGKPDGAVTERTAYAISELIRAADYLIDMHSGGIAMRVAPMSGYQLHRDQGVRAVSRRMARAFNLPIIWGTTPDLDGRTLSVARDANVPAIYTEYQGGGECDPAGVDAYVDGCLNVMAELNMIDREQPESHVELVVEDDRPGSGHMQINYPAPIDGLFTAAVALRDTVQIGDVLGTVTDVLGETKHEIAALQNGIVLTLRTLTRVHEGDCLAVILETDSA